MYSLREFEDGIRFVDVKADPNIFDGMTVSDMNRTAKEILKKFAQKVIGIDHPVYVNGDSINEYLHPSKSIDVNTRKAKLTAAGELDNLIDAGIPLPNKPDGEDGHFHPGVTDFSYYRTIFKIGNEFFEGIVNIKNIKMRKLLKDITKIRNITQDIVSSYGQNPKSNFLRDASMNSIRNSGENVKALINSDKLLENALLIENHSDKYKDTSRENKNLEMVHVLLSAFKDGDHVIPVQFEVKKLSDASNRLYITVTLTKIEADVLGSTPGKNQTRFLVPASTEYSLSDIIREINPQDKHYLKYLCLTTHSLKMYIRD